MSGSKDILITLSIKYKGNWEKMYQAISNKEPIDTKKCDNIKAITILDNEYPDSLKQSYKPPFVLFYKGNLNLLKEDNVAIYGTRKIREETKVLTENVDKVIITKNTIGNNSEVIKYAKKCIVIFNEAINKEPNENQLFLSEFYDSFKSQESCLTSNRIIAGLCNKLIIVNGERNTSVLTSIALQNGKDIYCIPNKFNEDTFNNRLISEGAIPLLRVEDLQ